MYQYTVVFDYKRDDGTWVYNQTYVTIFDAKGCHDKAARELEYYVGSFTEFRINKVFCD